MAVMTELLKAQI